MSSPDPSHTNVGRATGKAGAYGGSELGSKLGGAVGPPIIGSIVGNLVGERVGEKAIHETGIDERVTEAGDKLAGVIGKRNVDKLGDVVMTSLGYSDSETCICCPCLPASQVLLFLTLPFLVFNCYKLGVGVEYDINCSSQYNESQTEEYQHDSVINATTNSTSYPCEFGFHYLVASGSVWVVFLPFWISALFTTCWRQCCCCCCDPIVCCGTITDLLKRFCCECGKFNCCEFIWYGHCLFHIIWATLGFLWLTGLPIEYKNYDSYPEYEPPEDVWNTILASVALDYIFAGSELVHRVKLHKERNKTEYQDIEMQEQTQKINQ